MFFGKVCFISCYCYIMKFWQLSYTMFLHSFLVGWGKKKQVLQQVILSEARKEGQLEVVSVWSRRLVLKNGKSASGSLGLYSRCFWLTFIVRLSVVPGLFLGLCLHHSTSPRALLYLLIFSSPLFLTNVFKLDDLIGKREIVREG